MAAKEASFDVVSEVNMEEVKNAIQIALKGQLLILNWKTIN